jgi:Gpi18-like mannosyltransferase
MRAPSLSRSHPVKPSRAPRGGPQVVVARAPVTWGQLLALLLLGVTVAFLIIAALSPGYVSDIGTNKTWGRWIAQNGIQDAYRIPTDYPPVLLYFFGLAGWIYQHTADPTFSEKPALASQWYTFLIKLPGIGFHVVIAVAIYLWTRRFGPGLAFAAAALYAVNPAAVYDVAHLGQTDPVHAAFALLAVCALVDGRAAWAGAFLALTTLTKPQAWILLPVVSLALLIWYGRGAFIRGALGGLAAAALVVAPWIVTNRLHHGLRFLEALETKSVNSTALTAHAHNLWWLPTLVEWRFINDWEPLIGPLSYRAVAMTAVVMLVILVVARLHKLRPRDRIFTLVATLILGWFALTVRAHENHLFMALPFLAIGWALDRRVGVLLLLVSMGLLANLALHDPFLMSNYAAGPDPGHPLPDWVIVAQVLNVMLNLAVFGLALVETCGLRRWGMGATR